MTYCRKIRERDNAEGGFAMAKPQPDNLSDAARRREMARRMREKSRSRQVAVEVPKEAP